MLQVYAQVPDRGREIVESDQLYFELGAETQMLAGAQLAWMNGLTHLPAGAVIQRISSVADMDGQKVMDWEEQLRALGAPLGRLYLDDDHPSADALLRASGYERRTETTYCGTVAGNERTSLRILPVTSPELWQRKLRLHESSPELPDSHPAAAADWVDLERRKCATGTMAAFVAEYEGEVVGTFATIAGANLYRLKNLVIHPAWRRRGLAVDIIRWCSAASLSDGRSGICTLAVKGGAGDSLYRGAGLTPVGHRTEWTRPLC